MVTMRLALPSLLLVVLIRSGLCGQEPEETGETIADVPASSVWEDDIGNGAEQDQPFLFGSMDRFTQAARFEFSQAFYRNRGLEPEYQAHRFNGFRLEDPSSGWPRWRVWSGLYPYNRGGSAHTAPRSWQQGIPGLAGSENIEIRVQEQAEGIRTRFRWTNGNLRHLASLGQAGRLQGGQRYLLFGRLGTSGEGVSEGTARQDVTLMAGISGQKGSSWDWEFLHLVQSGRRGTSSPLTEEVSRIKGVRYNPNWGYFLGRPRNASTTKHTIALNSMRLWHEGRRMSLTLGLFGMLSVQRRGRLGYFGAPSPRPDYYRYLPSYYLQRGSLTPGDQLAIRQEFEMHSQLDWGELIRVNTAGLPNREASYFLYDQVSRGPEWNFYAALEWPSPSESIWRVAVSGSWATKENFGQITDLLGGTFVRNRDAFSGNLYALGIPEELETGDLYQYHYRMHYPRLRLHTTLDKRLGVLDTHWGYELGYLSARRVGYFQNEAFTVNSPAASSPISQLTHRFSGNMGWSPDHRNRLELTLLWERLPIQARDLWVFPEYSDEALPHDANPEAMEVDFSYYLRWRQFNGRFSLYRIALSGLRTSRIIYARTVNGSALGNRSTTGIDQENLGIEAGIDWEPLPDVTVFGSLSIGRHSWLGLARTRFYPLPEKSDTGGLVPWELGATHMKGLRVPGGPQTAWSLGVYFRRLSGWRLGVTFNGFADNYVAPSLLRRREGFLQGFDAVSAGDYALIRSSRIRERLAEASLLRVSVGRSWRKFGGFASVYLSVSNLLNTDFRTGGFEQSRHGHIDEWSEDALSGRPVFGNKYWFGQGRNFSLSLKFNQ